MSSKGVGLFLFPTDRLGGAERVTKTTISSFLEIDRFDLIICFVLAKKSSGTLDDLARNNKVQLVYTNAKSEIFGVPKLVSLINKYNFEFVFSSHSHLNGFSSLCRFLGLLKTNRLVARESTQTFERDFGWKGFIFRSMYLMYGAQDLIICQTSRMLESFNRNTSNRHASITKTLPNPIDIRTFNLTRQSPAELPIFCNASILIVWCGRMVEVKNPELAITTLHQLNKKSNNRYHLIMIGDGPLRAKVEARIQSLKLERDVTLLGYLSSPLNVMKQCKVGIITSKTEGFPNVLLEMLASGVSYVVSTDCAGDMHNVPSVYLTGTQSSEALSTLIIESSHKTRSDESVEAYFQKRTPISFIRELL